MHKLLINSLLITALSFNVNCSDYNDFNEDFMFNKHLMTTTSASIVGAGLVGTGVFYYLSRSKLTALIGGGISAIATYYLLQNKSQSKLIQDSYNNSQAQNNLRTQEINNLRNEIENLNSQHNQAINYMRIQHESYVSNMKQNFEQQTQEKSIGIEHLNSQHNQAINEMRTRHEQEILRMQQDSTQQIQKLETKHQQSFDELKSKHQSDFFEKEQTYRDILEQERKNLNDKYHEDFAKMQNQSKQEIFKMQKSFEQQIKNLKDQHQKVINDMQDQHEEEFSNMKQSLEQQISKNDKKYKKLEKRNNDKKEKLKNIYSEHEQEISNMKQNLEQQIQDLKDQHQKAINDRQNQYEQQISRMQQDFTKQIQNLKDQYQQSFDDMQNQHEEEFSNMKQILEQQIQCEEEDQYEEEEEALYDEEEALSEEEAIYEKDQNEEAISKKQTIYQGDISKDASVFEENQRRFFRSIEDRSFHYNDKISDYRNILSFINARNSCGKTPLMIAAEKQNSNLFFTLISLGADLDLCRNDLCLQNKNIKNLLEKIEALRRKTNPALEALKEYSTIQTGYENADNRKVLEAAAIYFLNKGDVIDSKNIKDLKIKSSSLEYFKNFNLLQYRSRNFSRSPLCIEILTKSPTEIPQNLSSQSINTFTIDKYTPFQIALSLNYFEIAHMMIDIGLDLKSKVKGASLIYTVIKEMENNIKTTEESDKTTKESEKQKIKDESTSLIQHLITKNVPVTINDLNFALQNNEEDIASLLIDHIDPNLINCKESIATPLHIACGNGLENVITKLINKEGVKINLPNIRGITPIQLANLHNHTGIVELLEEKGLLLSEQQKSFNSRLLSFGKNN